MSKQDFNEKDFSDVPQSNLEDRISLSRKIEERDMTYDLCTMLTSQQMNIFFLSRGGYTESEIADAVKTTTKNVRMQRVKIAEKLKKLCKQ